MAMYAHSLSVACRLLEPGPVMLVTTAHKGKADIMTQFGRVGMFMCLRGQLHQFVELCSEKKRSTSAVTAGIGK